MIWLLELLDVKDLRRDILNMGKAAVWQLSMWEVTDYADVISLADAHRIKRRDREKKMRPHALIRDGSAGDHV